MKKRKAVEANEDAAPKSSVSLIRNSDEPPLKKKKWINKQRILVFASRGISYRSRHLMEDLRCLLPQSKADSKKECKGDLKINNEISEMKNCNKCIYFEEKKHKDLYMWLADISKGPSVKFLVLNIHSMAELKMTGNSLKGSRPLLSFDENFEKPHWALLKEMFVQFFSTPQYHPHSKPFFDHIFTFSILQNKIWFRNFQMLEEDGQLVEIGPRMVLNPIKIFNESFGGETLWSNSHYISPSAFRRTKKDASKYKYVNKLMQKQHALDSVSEEPFVGDPTFEVFYMNPNKPEKLKTKRNKGKR